MKALELPAFVEPERAPACCDRCGAFRPEVVLDVVIPPAVRFRLCWICAHDVLEHGAPLGELAPVIQHCGCGREHIFPPHVLALRDITRGTERP